MEQFNSQGTAEKVFECGYLWAYLADLRSSAGSCHVHYNLFYDPLKHNGPLLPPAAALAPTLWPQFHLRWACPTEAQTGELEAQCRDMAIKFSELKKAKELAEKKAKETMIAMESQTTELRKEKQLRSKAVNVANRASKESEAINRAVQSLGCKVQFSSSGDCTVDFEGSTTESPLKMSASKRVSDVSKLLAAASRSNPIGRVCEALCPLRTGDGGCRWPDAELSVGGNMKAIHERSTLTFWMGLGFVQRKYRVSCGLGARKLRIMHSEVVANYSCPGCIGDPADRYPSCSSTSLTLEISKAEQKVAERMVTPFGNARPLCRTVSTLLQVSSGSGINAKAFVKQKEIQLKSKLFRWAEPTTINPKYASAMYKSHVTRLNLMHIGKGNTGVGPFAITIESKAFGTYYSGRKLKLKMVVAVAAAASIGRPLLWFGSYHRKNSFY
ncbi:hypothetical protein WN943_018824 [Citrus x changshan-huyou]